MALIDTRNIHPEWGPAYALYADTCNGRIDHAYTTMSKADMSVKPSEKFIPLKTLELRLAFGENIHKTKIRRPPYTFPALMSTFREYVRRCEGGQIFDYYYGILCIRHLILTLCMAAISENERLDLDTALESLRSTATRQTAINRLADHTQLMMKKGMNEGLEEALDVLGFSAHSGCVFERDGGLTPGDVKFLIDELWRGRKLIIPLRKRGLLSGFPALLFVLFYMTRASTHTGVKPPWHQIEDLFMRCSLGAVEYSESVLLREIPWWIQQLHYSNGSLPPLKDYFPVDQEDARMIVDRYLFLLKPRANRTFATNLVINQAIAMFRWIFCMIMPPDPKGLVLLDLVPDAVEAALERLVYEIDNERSFRMFGETLGWVRIYASDISRQINWFFQNVADQNQREAVVKRLYDMEVFDLYGRLLVIVIRESDSKRQSWDDYLSGLKLLGEVLATCPPVPIHQHHTNMGQWTRVATHLLSCHAGCIPTQTPNNIISEGLNAWEKMRPKVPKKAPQSYLCGNPRCPLAGIDGVLPDCHLLCEGCKKVKYCSSRCQQT